MISTHILLARIHSHGLNQISLGYVVFYDSVQGKAIAHLLARLWHCQLFLSPYIVYYFFFVQIMLSARGQLKVPLHALLPPPPAARLQVLFTFVEVRDGGGCVLEGNPQRKSWLLTHPV